MALDRTTIIPTDNSDLARQQFQTIVCGKKALIIVVLGDHDTSAKAVECADRRAGVVAAGFKRKVVWIKDRTALAGEIQRLPAGKVDISKEDLTNVVAFSVSLNATTMSIVHIGDPISFLQMDAVFMEAGTA